MAGAMRGLGRTGGCLWLPGPHWQGAGAQTLGPTGWAVQGARGRGRRPRTGGGRVSAGLWGEWAPGHVLCIEVRELVVQL